MLTKKRTVRRKKHHSGIPINFDLSYWLRENVRSEYDIYLKYDPDTRYFNFCFVIHTITSRMRRKNEN